MTDSAVQPALQKYVPVVFFSFNLPWSCQQTAKGIFALKEAVTDAIDYGAEVINIAGLGCSSIHAMKDTNSAQAKKDLECEVTLSNSPRGCNTAASKRYQGQARTAELFVSLLFKQMISDSCCG